jgi:hypothetical protein
VKTVYKWIKNHKKIWITVIIFCFVGAGISYFYFLLTMGLDDISGRGKFVSSTLSPNGKNIAIAYIYDKDSLSSDDMRVSITSLNSNKMKDTTIYWEYPLKNNPPKMKWLSNNVIQVEGKKITITDKSTYYSWK